ncbi:hypothetical protein C0991_001988 [Blastosporella zonata]|nr:hypothetical protein C0991_001988 [Blastosporella zonata]
MKRQSSTILRAQPEVGLSEPLKKISLHSINCINYFKTSVSQFSSALSAPFFHAYNNPKTIASTVLRCAEECKEEYDEWIAVLDARVVNLDVRLSTATSATLTGSTDGIEMQVIPTQVIAPTFSERDRATPEHIRVPPPYSATQPSSSPLAKPPPPEKVVALKEAWYRYVDSRVVEWKIAATTACVFVA